MNVVEKGPGFALWNNPYAIEGDALMKIAVIGAGAMGSLFGGYLSQKNEVHLVDIWKEHVDTINRDGLKIEEKTGEIRVFHPSATTDPNSVGTVDLAIVFVKSIQTAEAMERNISLIGKKTMVLSLQNGYGNDVDICKFVDKKNVVLGTTAHGCTMKEPGHIYHAGIGQNHIGPVGGDRAAAEKIATVLSDSGLQTDVSDNVLELVWSKLFVNVGINAITALLDKTNICIAENPYANAVSKELVYEAVSAANAGGAKFDAAAVFANVVDIAKKTGLNRSSMLQDVSKKRQTEIGKINGAIVKEAEAHHMEVPANKIIVNLIRAKEASY